MKKFFTMFLSAILSFCMLFVFSGCTPSGEIYLLKEAYNKGVLTIEDVQKVADYWSKGEVAPTALKKSVATEIEKTWLKKKQDEDDWYSRYTAKDVYVSEYFGEYRGAYVVVIEVRGLMHTAEYDPYEINIEGITIGITRKYLDRFVVYKR